MYNNSVKLGQKNKDHYYWADARFKLSIKLSDAQVYS